MYNGYVHDCWNNYLLKMMSSYAGSALLSGWEKVSLV